MEQFQVIRLDEIGPAIDAAHTRSAGQQGDHAPARFLAGGTTLLDLMKLDVEQPAQLLDIHRLPLHRVEATPYGVSIGATVRNADLANHPLITAQYPVLSQAILSGASAQLRNMATTGGNLMQRTRCIYFRNAASACNKRQPGSGCAAFDGYNRNLAILGTSASCIATNPSDMCVALSALDATVHLESTHGKRSVPIDEFFLLPGTTPQHETVLRTGELITHVTVPAAMAGKCSTYLKLRDRASYEFALASVAVVVSVSANRIAEVSIAFGGIGVKPWRSTEAETVLLGQPPGASVFREAADAALASAHPHSQNGFKVELAKRCLQQALKTVTQTA
jgi:xanthine dehydrogenase YagS FAD-binding subunit